MSWFSSRWTTVFVVMVMVIACLVADPVADPSLPLRSDWDAPFHSPLTAQRNALEAARKATAVRLDFKRRLLEELIAERLTLHEVADLFAELNAEFPSYVEVIHRSVPGHTAEERMARNVVEHLRGYPLAPTDRETVFARVKQQFQDRFGYPLEY